MEAWEGEKSEAEKAEDGLPIYAGMDETSWMLFPPIAPRSPWRAWRWRS
jgi:hypothetical protein